MCAPGEYPPLLGQRAGQPDRGAIHPGMPGRKSGTELDDLNLHVKSPLANDLVSRFGDLLITERCLARPSDAGPRYRYHRRRLRGVSADSQPGYRCCAAPPQPASPNWPNSGRPASGSAARAPGYCWASSAARARYGPDSTRTGARTSSAAIWPRRVPAPRPLPRLDRRGLPAMAGSHPGLAAARHRLTHPKSGTLLPRRDLSRSRSGFACSGYAGDGGSA